MSYRNTSLLGEYPHGSVLAWKSDKIEEFQSQIPFGNKILKSKPEVQALNLYRGDQDYSVRYSHFHQETE